MSEWQPIETAPKDADFVLLCEFSNEEDYPTDVFIGFWSAGWDGQRKDAPFWANWHCDPETNETGEWEEVHPTHWMPLPSPPQPSTASQPTR